MAKKLDWLRRFLGTMLGFVLFGVLGISYRIILSPYVKYVKNGDLSHVLQARRSVGKIWAFFVKYLVAVGVLEVEYHGFERLGRKGQLMVANHPSLLDVVLIFSKENRLNCIVKKDLLDNPVMVDPIIACGFLPNSESEEVLEKSHQILQEESLLLFPEGTRTGWDGVVNLHRGAVSIGLRSAEVITPIIIKMSPPNLKKGQPWYKVPSQKIRYQLTVAEDIDPKALLAEKPLPIASRRLKKQLEDLFNSHTHTI
ncbi:lysophospholipid acyltransferase family protein [Actinobacillus suis]|nr:lysophospholipid acyltransferase family protein [Actinobacillus suis]AIJ32207.1 phospholipid/glycerol acyltransferase [Actinobacillus suis ATCC 33415]MCO4169707.1 1-acyl-sn-glycerol-3-phosphate acyltransferase [Actinobacillus suis]MCQ9630806.1 1-acyl-sn-glycerol-3-phosphate acyltransferase [Actinobacillus suis]MCQ9633153.1 1-acyl-sn-glycerol-3-phosphate acyltransferase [Actinobacillus suis]MCQ9712378.1 1-acyl-sn-glycerol-3-phosphate acyltransferase [Actinobacillus suis]